MESPEKIMQGLQGTGLKVRQQIGSGKFVFHIDDMSMASPTYDIQVVGGDNARNHGHM